MTFVQPMMASRASEPTHEAQSLSAALIFVELKGQKISSMVAQTARRTASRHN
jgi:hypothetical protein